MADLHQRLAERERRRQQIADAPILAKPQEKLFALRADMAQMDEPREEFRRDLLCLVMGALAAFWICVGIAVCQNWDKIERLFG